MCENSTSFAISVNELPSDSLFGKVELRTGSLALLVATCKVCQLYQQQWTDEMPL